MRILEFVLEFHVTTSLTDWREAHLLERSNGLVTETSGSAGLTQEARQW